MFGEVQRKKELVVLQKEVSCTYVIQLSTSSIHLDKHVSICSLSGEVKPMTFGLAANTLSNADFFPFGLYVG